MKRLQETFDELLMSDATSLDPALALRDIEGWDSLMHVRLVLALQQNFKVELSADDIRSMVTIGEVERVLKEKGVDG